MSTSIERQVILNVESDIEGIKVKMNVRDGMISQIGMYIETTDAGGLGQKRVEFLFPHDGTLASLKRFNLQLRDVIDKTEMAIEDAQPL